MAYLRFLISQISRLPEYDNSSMREGIGQIYSSYPVIYLRRSSNFPNRFRPTSQDQLLKSAGSWKRGNSFASLWTRTEDCGPGVRPHVDSDTFSVRTIILIRNMKLNWNNMHVGHYHRMCMQSLSGRITHVLPDSNVDSASLLVP